MESRPKGSRMALDKLAEQLKPISDKDFVSPTTDSCPAYDPARLRGWPRRWTR